MVTALTMLLANPDRMAATRNLRNQLEAGILAAHPAAFVLGASAPRVPTTVNVCLPDVDAENLVDHMAANGIAISAGSACAHGARKPSHVATALGLTYDQAQSCARISLSVESTSEEVATFLSILRAELSDEPATLAVTAEGLR